MPYKDQGHLEIEDRGAVLIVRLDGGPHHVFGLDIANQLDELVDRVDRDPGIRAVVFTGAHPERFVSHAAVQWLQEEGAASPTVGRRGASAVARVARGADRARVLKPVVNRTPMRGAAQLDPSATRWRHGSYWALTVEPQVSYTALLPALIVCGIGMGMFFAPSANLVMSTVRPEEQGIASGANNAIREVGGAIGGASLAAVFSAQGGYGSASLFVDGLVPALWVGAGAVALAAALALLMPRQRKADGPAPALSGGTPAGAPAI